MAKKKITPIESLGKDTDKLLVQKSRPLFALWRSDMTLEEFKILDTYLSRIDSKKPDKRLVVFEKGELEKLLGVTKISVANLKKRVNNLCQTIDVSNPLDNKRFHLVALFEEAIAEQDEHGVWQVKLECTQKAMKYIFNIDNIGYLRYKLRCITSLKSRQAYVLFTFLEANRFRTPFEVGLQELKEILCCEKEELYKEFKYFNRDVLKRIQKELIEKTECQFTYEPVKKGRTVVGIRFILETLPKASVEEIDPNQITIEQYQEDLNRPLWEGILDKYDFTSEQIEELRGVLALIPRDILPQSPELYGDLELMRYHHMKNKVNEIERRDKVKPIARKYSYLLKLLKNDAEVK